jgi:N-acetylmuramoyl-L-alanine amidase
MGKLTYLVIHCTATPEGVPVTSKQIRHWHTAPKPEGRGWKQVGYRDMIHLNGLVENLVPYDNDDEVEPWEITNGVAGINSIAAHVVYVGGTEALDIKKAKDTRNKEQLAALANYVRMTIAAHPSIQVGGHNQFDKGKACPSFDVPRWLKGIGIQEKNICRL